MRHHSGVKSTEPSNALLNATNVIVQLVKSNVNLTSNASKLSTLTIFVRRSFLKTALLTNLIDALMEDAEKTNISVLQSWSAHLVTTCAQIKDVF